MLAPRRSEIRDKYKGEVIGEVTQDTRRDLRAKIHKSPPRGREGKANAEALPLRAPQRPWSVAPVSSGRARDPALFGHPGFRSRKRPLRPEEPLARLFLVGKTAEKDVSEDEHQERQRAEEGSGLGEQVVRKDRYHRFFTSFLLAQCGAR